MPIKKQEYEIIEEFNKRDLTILNIEKYKNRSTKMDCFDSNNYKYLLNYDNVRDKRTVSFDLVAKHNIYSMHNIQNFIKLNGGNCSVVSKNYDGTRKKLRLRCNCGCEYDILWYHLEQHKKFTCNNCSTKERVAKTLKPYEYADNICKENGYELISVDTLRKVIFKDKEGYKYKSTIYSMQKRKYGTDRFSKENPFTIYNMCNYIKKNDFKIRLVDETERKIGIAKDYLEFYCCDCGEIYTATWGQVAYKTKKSMLRHRCPKCSKSESNLEYEVKVYLDNLGIKYTKQKRFSDCRNVGLLPFDFYLDDYNLAIEVQGDQHFYESELFSQTLEERKRIDKIKKDYCVTNNIRYIAIPSWDIVKPNKKYRKTINNILN